MMKSRMEQYLDVSSEHLVSLHDSLNLAMIFRMAKTLHDSE